MDIKEKIKILEKDNIRDLYMVIQKFHEDII